MYFKDHPTSYPSHKGIFFRGVKAVGGVKLTTHVHEILMSRFQDCGQCSGVTFSYRGNFTVYM